MPLQSLTKWRRRKKKQINKNKRQTTYTQEVFIATAQGHIFFARHYFLLFWCFHFANTRNILIKGKRTMNEWRYFRHIRPEMWAIFVRAQFSTIHSLVRLASSSLLTISHAFRINVLRVGHCSLCILYFYAHMLQCAQARYTFTIRY